MTSSTHEVRCLNPNCGALNRVPRYSIKRVPTCGKCQAELPESEATQKLRTVYAFAFSRRFRRLRIAAFITSLVGFLVWADWDVLRIQIADALNPPKACKAQARPAQGVFAVYTRSARAIPLTIQTSSGSNYFVKFETTTSAPVMSFFVWGGVPLETQVPSGTFVVKHAAGTNWCDERDLFGKETATEKGKRLAVFDEYHQYVLKLIPQTNGNFPTERIARNQF